MSFYLTRREKPKRLGRNVIQSLARVKTQAFWNQLLRRRLSSPPSSTSPAGSAAGDGTAVAFPPK